MVEQIDCLKHIMLYFVDIEPVLVENENIDPSCRLKLLGILGDARNCAMLKVELAATIDYGEPFVKACYFLMQ